MIYYKLAQSFNEMDLLAKLIVQLERGLMPIEVLETTGFLSMEIARIKRQTDRDILIFATSTKVYLHAQLIKIYELISRILDVLRQLPDLLLTDQQRYTHLHCSAMREVLRDLAAFLESRKDSWNARQK